MQFSWQCATCIYSLQPVFTVCNCCDSLKRSWQCEQAKCLFTLFILFSQAKRLWTLRDRKWLPWVHLIGCWGVKLLLTIDFLKLCQKLSCQNNFFEFCQSFSFWVFVTIWFFLVELQFKFLSFITTWLCKLCCYLSLSFVAIWVLSKIEFLSCKNLSLSFVTIWVKFGLNFSFWVLSQLEFLILWNFQFLSFATIWVEFSHKLSFGVLSQF